MNEFLASGHIIPLGAFVVACVLGGMGIWKKVRESELAHEQIMRIREMEHAERMKTLELETLRASKQAE